MHIFENVKMRRLLNKRNKLQAELSVLENDNYHLYEQIVYPGGMSAERYFKINIIRGQIQAINAQISELLEKD